MNGVKPKTSIFSWNHQALYLKKTPFVCNVTVSMLCSDPSQPTAADVVNTMSESGLYRIIKKYGEDKKARLIARAIVDTRYAFGKIHTTQQLANIISSVYRM